MAPVRSASFRSRVRRDIETAVGDADETGTTPASVSSKSRHRTTSGRCADRIGRSAPAEKLVGAQVAFQQDIDAAVARHFYCGLGSIFNIDKLCLPNQLRESECLRQGADLLLVADQHREGDAEM